MRHVVFRLHTDKYAVALSAVREVVDAPASFTRVPRAPRSLRGVINLRGRVVPIIDLEQLLDIEGSAPAGTQKIIMLERGRRDLGLLVTQIDGIETIERVGQAAKPHPMVRGLAKLNEVAVTVLNVDSLDASVAQAFTSM